MADHQERKDARAQMVMGLFEAGDTSAQLEKLSNKELAKLIQAHLMPDLSMLEPAFLLLDEVVQRLEGFDYKEMILKYMAQVGSFEGVNFIQGYSNEDLFTDEEWEEMQRLAKL